MPGILDCLAADIAARLIDPIPDALATFAGTDLHGDLAVIIQAAIRSDFTELLDSSRAEPVTPKLAPVAPR